MKLVFYIFAVVTYIQCGLGDPSIGHVEPPKPLSMKDVQRYVMETSKVVEELAKEHLWLLSMLTGTNNWEDLLGDGEPSLRKKGDRGESLEQEEPGFKHQDDSGVGGDTGGGGGIVKEAVVEDKSPLPVEVQSKKEVEINSQAEDQTLEKPMVDAFTTDLMKMLVQELTAQTTRDLLHSLPFHSQNGHSNNRQHPQTPNSLKPDLNPKIGYTTDIRRGNHPDPSLNYLALKDKPIQHNFDAYGKPINESDKLQIGSEEYNPVTLASPQVLNTQERDVVFSPLSVEKPIKRQVTALHSKNPTSVEVGAKTPKSSNPFAHIYNTHQVKPETNTHPKGIYNPLALDSSYINDVFNDINNVASNKLMTTTNEHSIMNQVQSDKPDRNPLDYPVQYYKPESLPSNHVSPYRHPAHRSRLEENDIGW